MNTTSLTLLERLRSPGDQEAWLRFVKLYTPLLIHWTRRIGVSKHDAEDLIQDIFALLLRKLPEFRYKSGGSFRSWLRVVALNKLRERHRQCQHGESNRVASAVVTLGTAVEEVPAPDEAAGFEETEYRKVLVGRGLELIRPEFNDTTWRAFHEHVEVGRGAAEVATQLNLRVGTVYAAKSRVLHRLRQELDGLMDDE